MRTCNIELTSYGDCPFFFLCLTVNVGPFSCRSCSSSSAGMRTEYSSWKKERFQWVIQEIEYFPQQPTLELPFSLSLSASSESRTSCCLRDILPKLLEVEFRQNLTLMWCFQFVVNWGICIIVPLVTKIEHLITLRENSTNTPGPPVLTSDD